VLYRLIIIVFLLFYSTYFILRSELQLPLHYSTPTPSSSASSGSSSDASDSSSGSGFGSLGSSYDEKFTIRVNTFRRNDLLEAFLFHYTTCSKVTHSLTHSLTHSFIHSFTHPSIHFIDLLIGSLVQPRYSFTRSLTHHHKHNYFSVGGSDTSGMV
jgi:hypothetical protein